MMIMDVQYDDMPGVGFMVRVGSLGSSDPEFKSHSSVELIPGGVDSACHPSEVGKMSASFLVSCVGVVTHPGLCPNSQGDYFGSTNALHRVGPNGWMDDIRCMIMDVLHDHRYMMDMPHDNCYMIEDVQHDHRRVG